MTGTFSSAIQAQIDGQSTAPITGPTSTGKSSATMTSSSRSVSVTGSSTASAAAAAVSDNASTKVSAGTGLMALVSAVIGVTACIITL